MIRYIMIIDNEKEYIKCESAHHKDSIDAERYCSTCQKALCISCVVDYHFEHIKEAKLKIEELFTNKKKIIREDIDKSN